MTNQAATPASAPVAVEDVTGIKVVSLHRDISTVTGEKVVIFTLAEAPRFRAAQKK